MVNIGKRYNKNYVFKNLSYVFEPNKTYAITGKNGSGKSTLLQIIYGYLTHSEGEILYTFNGIKINEGELYKHVSFTSPYLELPEDFTLAEILDFHFSLVQPVSSFNVAEVLKQSKLAGSENKFIKAFSSGMKQRLKLILAIYTQSPLLLLDEPTSNLDDEGMFWYKQTILSNHSKRTIIIASNQHFEYDFCDDVIKISDY